MCGLGPHRTVDRGVGIAPVDGSRASGSGGEDGPSLTSRAERDVLRRGRHLDRDAEHLGRDPAYGLGLGAPAGSGPAIQGVMTRGIHDPYEYYYRRVFTDAVRLVDAVAEMPFVDASRIAVTGGSQGGGITLAAAALSERVAAVLPDVPFLCDFPRAITRSLSDPFTEVTRYLSVHREDASAVRRTLSYFDGAVLARRITAPSLLSVALMDEIVLPSTVFAAFNAIPAPDKSIEVYEFNGHEGGGAHHWLRQTAWLAERF